MLRVALFFLLVASQIADGASKNFDAEGVRIPLFDHVTGNKWGEVEISAIRTEGKSIGPFPLGIMRQPSFDSLTLRIIEWPDPDSFSQLNGIAVAPFNGDSISIAHLRIEHEKQWAIDLQNAQITIHPSHWHVSAQQGRLADELGIRAIKRPSIEPDRAFSHLILRHNDKQKAILPKPTHHD